MASAVSHRGPDDADCWVDPARGVAMGFRRLAIVDLTPTGRQPMHSRSTRYVITFNGEIYNFQALRDELTQFGHAFVGGSDTEVILASIEQWGVRGAVERFNGQFAIALWDRQTRQLTLVRDRLGINPLYYGTHSGVLLFGSELKGLRQHKAFSAELNQTALALFMRHGYVPTPFTIYNGIHKLPPGHLLTISHLDKPLPQPDAYWSLRDVARAERRPMSRDEALDQLDSVLREAVRLRMIADVPLGAFLSGGIDSSTVVALMQAQSSQPVKTFSIGFDEADHNEAVHAAQVAKYLGTDHTELYVRPETSRAVIPQLPTMFDEPFADSSQIPTYLVSKLAREHVTVSLSGDGGDELFCGYERYTRTWERWQRLDRVPQRLRGGLARAMTTPQADAYDRWLAPLTPLLARQGQKLGNRVHSLGRILATNSSRLMYEHMVSQWHIGDIMPGRSEPSYTFNDMSLWDTPDHLMEKMMLVDAATYLHDDILTKVDRASMAVSLEARVPLLDHNVVEFAWTVPMSLKYGDGVRKILLRELLYRYVPKSLVERPKMGFGVPIGAWLRGPLRDWAEELLSAEALAQHADLNVPLIRERWREHASGERDWLAPIWNVLMFQAWAAEWL